MANRLKMVIPGIISPNQSAFIKGRKISDNLVLCHEKVRGFHRLNCKGKMVIKVDLHKAFDSVDRLALMEYMAQLNFGPKWIRAIKSILEAPKFSVLINGTPHGFFGSKVGIKQGDPLSPYLFTIIMEVFSVMINQAFHPGRIQSNRRGGEPDVSHLLFAADLSFVKLLQSRQGA